MKKSLLSLTVAALLVPSLSYAATGLSLTKEWTFSHSIASEISSFDAATNSIWVAGVTGVDILDLNTGSQTGFINVSPFGSINSIDIYNGIAAFAIENHVRSDNGFVQFYNTGSQDIVKQVTVGALPDMVKFTPNGSKLLVANEGTPDVYGSAIGSSTPQVFGAAPNDPVGPVSIIDTSSSDFTNAHVIATAGFDGVAQSGSHIRTNTGMDFEPEYIAVNEAGTKAFVTLQEANAVGVLDIESNSFEHVIGLGAKDFSAPGNEIDPSDKDGGINFGSHDVQGLYMPDGIESFDANGQTYMIMANEGDFREDDGDRIRAKDLGVDEPLDRIRVSSTDSTADELYAPGARSFSIRDIDGNIVFDSGDTLDKEAAKLGIYDDGRSDDKGVEPEGVTVIDLGESTYAFIGLERTTTSALAIYDITDPANSLFLDMLVTEGDVSPEGIEAFYAGGKAYLSISNEVSQTTSLYSISPVPEPSTYALLLSGLALVGFTARRKKRA
jgi:hypothetical protein